MYNVEPARTPKQRERRSEHRAYYLKHRQAKLEYAKQYRARHPEKTKAAARLWKQQHPSQTKEYVWASTIKARYGITREQYCELLAKQNHRCAICNIHVNALGKKFSVDHCHASNRVRGLLCMFCNSMLGQAFDNPVILRAALRYLERHG